MLPGDRDVVGRDPALPGLRLALDADALTDRLAACWPADEPPPERIAPTYLRYKPATHLLASVEVTRCGRTTTGLLVTTSGRSVSKIDKLRDYARRRSGRLPLVVDPEIPLLLAPIEADRRLPGTHRLLTRVGRLDRDLRGATGTVLSYKPHRRLVVRLDVDGQPRALAKVHHEAAAQGVMAALDWAERVGGERLPLPSLLGADAEHGIVVTAWTPGWSLEEHEPERQRATLRLIGKVLGRLHRQDPAGLPAPDPAPPERSARAAIVRLRPDLTSLVDDALREPPPPSPSAAVHGDLSPDQVVHGPDGVALIDLDRASAGAPAADLASWIAASLCDGHGDPHDAALSAALWDGYRSVDGPASVGDVAAHLPLQLLRRATDPFRLRRPDWHARMELLVRSAATRPVGTVVGP